MNVVDLMQKAKDSVDIHQVFGEPYQVGDVTIIPVARIGGGGGAGGPMGAHAAAPGGEGYGFGIQASGVYAIKSGSVKWVPAVNVNAIVTGAFIVGIVAIWKAPRIIKAAGKVLG